MKEIIIAAVVLLLVTNAHATKPKPPETPDIENKAVAVSGSESSSKARSESESSAKASNETDVDVSNAVDIAAETGDIDVDIDGDDIVYNFPSNTSYAPPSFSNIRCGEVFGFGYTNESGSGSAGLPVPRWLSGKIKDCEANADSNWLAEAGLPLAAIEARCATRSMRDRFGGSMKGPKDRTTACITKLKGLARDEAQLEGLRNAVEILKKDKEKLAGKVADLESDVGRCNKARQRTEQAWKECQAK